MLPRVLAADLCSLLPEVDRYCLCVIAELDRSGNRQELRDRRRRDALPPRDSPTAEWRGRWASTQNHHTAPPPRR